MRRETVTNEQQNAGGSTEKAAPQTAASPNQPQGLVPSRDATVRPTMPPRVNKFHVGNLADGKHYWLTPPALMAELQAQYEFTFDPCPYPKPDDFDGLTAEWGASNYVNPPFGSIMHEGKRVVLVYPIDKWVLMLLAAGATVRNLGDVRWHATEDGSAGRGTGRHVAAFVLDVPDIANVAEEAA